MKRVTRSGKVDLIDVSSRPPKRPRKKASNETKNVDPHIEIDDTKNVIDENSNEVLMSSNDDSVDLSPAELQQIEVLKLLKEIMGLKYLNVVDRLKLDWIPDCVKDYNVCEQHQQVPEWTDADFFQLDMAKTLFFTNSNQHSKGGCLLCDFP